MTDTFVVLKAAVVNDTAIPDEVYATLNRNQRSKWALRPSEERGFWVSGNGFGSDNNRSPERTGERTKVSQTARVQFG